jgi:hypothetical protein
MMMVWIVHCGCSDEKKKETFDFFLNVFVLRILIDPLEVHVGEHLFIFYLGWILLPVEL